VSVQQILAELPKLTPIERRRIASQIFDLESDPQVLADADARADQNFLTLDQMEEGASKKLR
jgi:hypothetical protein